MSAIAKGVKNLAFKRWAYNWSGFNRYGLFFDDILYEDEDVLEALRRLPAKTVDERHYRLLRAAQLSMQKIVLPKEMWHTYDDDVKNRYLGPIVAQVKKERLEKEEWESNY